MDSVILVLTTAPWEPSAAEPEPDAKRLAAATALALLHYPVGSSGRELAETVGIERSAALDEWVDPTQESMGSVVYPQFVGIDSDGAAVTVLVERTVRDSDGSEATETRSLDVRLRRDGESWIVVGVSSVGGPAIVSPADLAGEARLVDEHSRIHLPSSARWDVYRGDVHPELLELLAEMAERHDVHVLTFVSGRPDYVFGTDRLSNHARGRAVDIYALDGVPVIEQVEEGSTAHALVRWLHEQGVEELGSPWDLDGPGGRSFTDAAHQDHIHVAVEP